MAERIPDDIMREARTLALEVFHNCVDSDDGSESLDTPVAAELIAAALLARDKLARDAERKRAAEIARRYPERDPGGDGNGYWAADEIATAILASKGGGNG